MQHGFRRCRAELERSCNDVNDQIRIARWGAVAVPAVPSSGLSPPRGTAGRDGEGRPVMSFWRTWWTSAQRRLSDAASPEAPDSAPADSAPDARPSPRTLHALAPRLCDDDPDVSRRAALEASALLAALRPSCLPAAECLFRSVVVVYSAEHRAWNGLAPTALDHLRRDDYQREPLTILASGGRARGGQPLARALRAASAARRRRQPARPTRRR
jgi:hypothetical protein